MDQNKVSTYANGTVTLGLCLTEDCNLACTYCNVSKTRKKIDTDHVNAALAYFLRFYKNASSYHIVFQGGETLLAPKLLKRTILTIRKLEADIGKHIIISLPTNGILLSNSWMTFFLHFRVNLSLSLDSLVSQKNARVFKNGEPSVEPLQKILPLYMTYHKLQPMKFRISSVILPENIDEYSGFAEQMIKSGAKVLYVQPAHGIFWSDNDIYRMKELVKKMRTIFENHGIDSNIVGISASLDQKKGCGKRAARNMHRCLWKYTCMQCVSGFFPGEQKAICIG